MRSILKSIKNRFSRSRKDSEEKQPEKVLDAYERSVIRYQWFVLRVIIVLCAFWFLLAKIIGVVRMGSEDMYPHIKSGDLVLFYRLDKDVSAQDIVVLKKTPPDGVREELFVLRVVAVEGDTVNINDSEHLVINGSTMIEDNIYTDTPRYDGFTEYPLKLGRGECFVLADARTGGVDSRYFGAVRKSDLLGSVITIMRRNGL